MKYKHILLATDFSQDSEILFKKARELAREMDSQLSVIHVVEPLPGYGYAFIGSAEVEMQLVEEAKKRLIEIGEKYAIDRKDVYVEIGPTKVEITRIAKEKHVDLIVVGSHGHHGIDFLLGSTANAVVHGAYCDVLTIRFKEK